MLDWIALKMRVRAVALHGQIDNDEAAVSYLLRCQDATDFIRSRGAELTFERSDASLV